MVIIINLDYNGDVFVFHISFIFYVRQIVVDYLGEYCNNDYGAFLNVVCTRSDLIYQVVYSK